MTASAIRPLRGADFGTEQILRPGGTIQNNHKKGRPQAALFSFA
jgi:hypothetical protein